MKYFNAFTYLVTVALAFSLFSKNQEIDEYKQNIVDLKSEIIKLKQQVSVKEFEKKQMELKLNKQNRKEFNEINYSTTVGSHTIVIP